MPSSPINKVHYTSGSNLDMMNIGKSMASDPRQDVCTINFYGERATTVPLEWIRITPLPPPPHSPHTLLVPTPGSWAHNMEVSIVSFADTLAWQLSLLNMGTWFSFDLAHKHTKEELFFDTSACWRVAALCIALSSSVRPHPDEKVKHYLARKSHRRCDRIFFQKRHPHQAGRPGKMRKDSLFHLISISLVRKKERQNAFGIFG